MSIGSANAGSGTSVERDMAARPDRVSLALVFGGLALAYLPTYWDFLFGRWAADAQGHEAAVVAIVAWLLYRQRHALVSLPPAADQRAALCLLLAGVVLYTFGRGQQFLRAELVSQVFVLGALITSYRGWAGLKLLWFPLVFLMFVVPLPFSLILALTAPLKAAVSAVSTQLMFWAGYPVGRSGVVVTVGQYELLVATACAGLQTMFTLEALGLLYVSLKGYRSWQRNALMAILVVPVSFCANVIRVLALALVTYHFGDDAGRGFFHGFAGIVLFLAALLLIMSTDRALTWLLPPRYRQ